MEAMIVRVSFFFDFAPCVLCSPLKHSLVVCTIDLDSYKLLSLRYHYPYSMHLEMNLSDHPSEFWRRLLRGGEEHRQRLRERGKVQ